MIFLYKIKKFKPKTIYLLLSLILSLLSFNQTLAFDKECGYLKLKTKYSSTNGEFDPTAERGFIIGHEKIFVNESDQNQKQNSLEFGKLVQIIDPGSRNGNRIKISNEYAPEEIIGWVERDNVLCRNKPLRDPTTKLWRRVFIQTTEKKVGESNELREPVKLFQSSEGDCFDTGCGQITPYKWFFAFGERNGKVLLSNTQLLENTNKWQDGLMKQRE